MAKTILSQDSKKSAFSALVFMKIMDLKFCFF
jgi:hypothetical protein